MFRFQLSLSSSLSLISQVTPLHGWWLNLVQV